MLAESRQVTQHVTLVGAVVNLVLSILKILFGWIGQSQALIMDGVHSLSDLLSDALVILATRFSHRQADASHPYGHQRIETVATVGMGMLLLMVAGGIVWDGIHSLLYPRQFWQPGWLAFSIAALSIIAKEILYHYTLHAANKIQSPLLKANAWHHRSDAWSSVAVLLGIVGSMVGVVWMDIVAAIVVGAMIGHVGWSLIWNSLQELIDTGVDAETLAHCKHIIKTVSGVQALHQLRTRRMGNNVLIDGHIQVAADLTVSEGHHIGEIVRDRLIASDKNISDVTLHIDPENDETADLCQKLPLRDQVIENLNDCWQELELSQKIDQINLHYLAGYINVDIYLPLDSVRDQDDLSGIVNDFSSAINAVDYVKRIQVYYH